jgi:hypothetical protein
LLFNNSYLLLFHLLSSTPCASIGIIVILWQKSKHWITEKWHELKSIDRCTVIFKFFMWGLGWVHWVVRKLGWPLFSCFFAFLWPNFLKSFEGVHELCILHKIDYFYYFSGPPGSPSLSSSSLLPSGIRSGRRLTSDEHQQSRMLTTHRMAFEMSEYLTTPGWFFISFFQYLQFSAKNLTGSLYL